MSTQTLFAYGTLLHVHVQRAVIGREIAGTPAQLAGYRKTTLRDGTEVFPNLVPESESTVSGRILEVTDAELALIDRYEGDLYARHRVTLTNGAEVWVYHA